MGIFNQLFGSEPKAPEQNEREEKLQSIIKEGNDFIRANRDASYAVIMQKEAEIEAECKKLHGYFYKEPDVQLILKELQENYQMDEGTRFSVNKKGNRILNYRGE
ncbi:MAG: hypothetical protein IJ720_04075 [Clostridia bacterium]|nr:hypothetical protein [Clostridia bacterium]MBR1704525.1 hypothetical protein [Clostridia bacterium]